MPTIEKAIEVEAPVRSAYNQWTQFEEFPEFMGDIDRVEQLAEDRLRWHATIAGKPEQWEAHIDEQIPDKRIAWHSTKGAANAGCVTFHRLSDDRSRVMLQLSYEPEGVLENVGDFLGFTDRGVERDLKQFKRFIEERGRATGGWRGEIPAKEER